MELALQLIAEAKRTKATRLDLGNCGLTELPDELFELVWLEELILSNWWWEYDIQTKDWDSYSSFNNGANNEITNFGKLINLPVGIKKIILKGQKNLSDLTPLRNLVNLQQLYVSDTKVNSLNALSGLKKLQVLVVSGTKIKDLKHLSRLSELQVLRLSHTDVKNLESIEGLGNLIELEFYETYVEDLNSLKGLKNLERICFFNSSISNLSPLRNLHNLEDLNASNTDISELIELEGLKKIKLLNVSETTVSDLRPLRALTNLEMLDVSETQVRDLTPLGDLHNLKELYISKTKVFEFGTLKRLIGLRNLWVGKLKLSSIDFLQDLTNMEALSVSDTKVSGLSPLKCLNSLKELSISNTLVSDLSILKDLTNLQELNVSGTLVNDLSPLKGLVSLRELRVRDCGIQYIPKEIVDVWNCADSLFAYWEELYTAQTVQNRQLKVMFLGNGCVGKSTLLHWFLNKEFTPISLEEGRTHGIFIKPYLFEDSEVLAHLWDFGGQEVFHATHRLFLGRRSLYVLVWATESPEPNDDMRHPPQYWLDMIADIANPHERSRVLIVQNLFEDQKERNILSDYERKAYEEMGLDITTYCVDAKSGHKVKSLVSNIEEEAAQLIDTYVEELPDTWVVIRQKVMERKFGGDKLLAWETFLQDCSEARLSTDPMIVLGYLHRSGALYYYENRFGNQIILDQEWALKAVYAILKRSKIDMFKGRIPKASMIEMWQRDGLVGSEKEAEVFLAFMLSNKMAIYAEENIWEIENSILVIPQLLPIDAPKRRQTWERVGDKVCHRIEYRFLHRDIIERFMVQTAHLSKDISEDIWRSGLFIEYGQDDEALIEVVEIEGKRLIQIECAGHTRLELLQKIREEFFEIRTLEKAQEWRLENGVWVEFTEKIAMEQSGNKDFGLSLNETYPSPNTMNTMSLKEYLKDKLANGQLTDAINIMRKISSTQHPDFGNTTILLSGQNAGNESQMQKGELSNEEYKRSRARLRSAILSLLDSEYKEAKVPEELKKEVMVDDEQPVFEKLKEAEEVSKDGAMRILMLTANPAETTLLNISKEHSRITTKLQDYQDRFRFVRKDAVDKTAFKEETEQFKPSILHFSGHGDAYEGIVLQNEDRNSHEMLSASKLEILFGYFQKRFSIACVVLNACYSEAQAMSIGRNVKYVIGTTKSIKDEHAIAFSKGFYFKLASLGTLDYKLAYESGRMEAIMEGADIGDFVLFENGQRVDL